MSRLPRGAARLVPALELALAVAPEQPPFDMTISLGWLTSALDPQAVTILNSVCEAQRDGVLDAEVQFIVCVRGRAESTFADQIQSIARIHGIPAMSVGSDDLLGDVGRRGSDDKTAGNEVWRARLEHRILDAIPNCRPDVVALIGYMLIAGPTLLEKWRMVNLHPALPGGPVGSQRAVIKELAATGAAHAGAMMHVVNAELDRGPALTYCRFPLTGPWWQERRERGDDCLRHSIREAILACEPRLVVATLDLLSRRKLTSWPPEWIETGPVELVIGNDDSLDQE